MKALYIPIAFLALILGFSLWTGRYVELRTGHWSALLEQIDDTARQENWSDAQKNLDQAYQDWLSSQTFFHTIMDHEELDQAENLFQGALAICEEKDDADFHLLLAQLICQLRLLAETQSISIKNIL